MHHFQFHGFLVHCIFQTLKIKVSAVLKMYSTAQWLQWQQLLFRLDKFCLRHIHAEQLTERTVLNNTHLLYVIFLCSLLSAILQSYWPVHFSARTSPPTDSYLDLFMAKELRVLVPLRWIISWMIAACMRNEKHDVCFSYICFNSICTDCCTISPCRRTIWLPNER